MLKRLLFFLILVLAAVGVFAAVLFNGLAPVSPSAEPRYFRVEKGETIAEVLERLGNDGFIANAKYVRWHHRVFGEEGDVHRGTYEISAAQSGDEILKHLLYSEPVRQMVLIKEGLWVSEVAATLEAKQVAPKDEVL